MAASVGPALRDLYEEFGERIAFVTLYVREAHPGERMDQPQDMETKLEHARAYRERDQIPWPVAVDDIEGSLHRRLGPADTAYVMDREGLVASRLLWAADVRGLRHALEAAVTGIGGAERRTRVVPVLRGASELQRILGLAGPRASRDILKVMPPVWVAGRIAPALPPMSPLARGVTATTASVAGHAAMMAAGRAVIRRLRQRTAQHAGETTTILVVRNADRRTHASMR